jgi:hypothetical protein
MGCRAIDRHEHPKVQYSEQKIQRLNRTLGQFIPFYIIKFSSHFPRNNFSGFFTVCLVGIASGRFLKDFLGRNVSVSCFFLCKTNTKRTLYVVTFNYLEMPLTFKMR